MNKERNLYLFDVPSNAGCLELGTESSPGHFRERGLIENLERCGLRVFDLGSVPLPELTRHNLPPIRNYPSPKIVWEATIAFFKNQTPVDGKGIFFCLGGDCSIVVGTVAAMIQLQGPGKIHILYVDGDTDSIVPDPKQCVGSAGMGIHFLTQESIYWDSHKLSPDQITIIGCKEPPPSDFAIPVISLERLRAEGITHSMKNILQGIPPERRLFIHFDVDVLAKDEMPAAYAPRASGLSVTEVSQILSLLLGDRRTVFFEVTEFVPAKDPEGNYGRSLVKLISQAFIAH